MFCLGVLLEKARLFSSTGPHMPRQFHAHPRHPDSRGRLRWEENNVPYGTLIDIYGGPYGTALCLWDPKFSPPMQVLLLSAFQSGMVMGMICGSILIMHIALLLEMLVFCFYLSSEMPIFVCIEIKSTLDLYGLCYNFVDIVIGCPKSLT